MGVAACLGLFWYYLEQGPPLFSFLADFYIEKSLSAWQDRNYGNALRYANSAITVKPDNPIAWNNRSAAYNSMGNWEGGMTAARHALRIAPGFELAANNYRLAASHDQFFGLIPNNNNTNPNAPFDKESLTLNELFIRDETLGGVQSCTARPIPPPINERNLVIAWCVVWEPSLNIKIMKVSIPEWPNTFGVAQSFTEHYNEFLVFLSKNNMSTQAPGTPVERWESAPFNGTIFMYHDTVMTPEQLGDLVKFYRSKKLTLSFRDTAYLDRVLKRSSQ